MKKTNKELKGICFPQENLSREGWKCGCAVIQLLDIATNLTSTWERMTQPKAQSWDRKWWNSSARIWSGKATMYTWTGKLCFFCNTYAYYDSLSMKLILVHVLIIHFLLHLLGSLHQFLLWGFWKTMEFTVVVPSKSTQLDSSNKSPHQGDWHEGRADPRNMATLW